MKNAFFLLIILLFATACPRHSASEPSAPDTGKTSVTYLKMEPITLEELMAPEEKEEEVIEIEDFWISSVKGHVNPGSKINNEVNEVWIDLSWTPEKGRGKVELVPAMRFDLKTNRYLDIHTNEPLKNEYHSYEDAMWYLQIDAPYEVVEPLFLEFYFDARLVYEGDLDRDGIPDFGILLKRMSNCCSYALLTIKDGQWALMKYPYGVSYNLRASGKELARRGAKKGEIIITQSDYSDFSNSDCWEAPIKDSVILYRRINAQDYFNEQN